MSSKSRTMLRFPWADPLTLDPCLVGDVMSNVIIAQLFDGLTEWNERRESVPNLAHHWEISEDGCRYLFHLREDARWSDGVPVTAGDVEYAYRRILDPRTGPADPQWTYDVKNAQAFRDGKVEWDQVGVEVIDDHTLVIQLDAPTGYYLDRVADPIPRHLVENKGSDWTTLENIVTNGPFLLESWTPGETMLLSRNPGYHGTFSGNVDRVELVLAGFGPEAVTKTLTMYERDELDVWWVNLPEGEEARQRYAEEYIRREMANTQFLCFDTSRAPFDRVQVRRAFAMATDRDRLATQILKGMAMPATGGLVPPAVAGHSAGIALPFDPDQARQLLSEAGYAAGARFPQVTAIGMDQQLCDFLHAEWREILGVDVSWDVLEFPQVRQRLESTPPHVYFMGWASRGDPDVYLRICVYRMQHHWTDDTYAELVEKARHLADQDERMVIYGRADEILIENAAIVPLTYGENHLLVKPWVKLPETRFLLFKHALNKTS